MNRTEPLPLTGGIPQPLTRLQDCLIAAECESQGALCLKDTMKRNY